MFKDLKIDLNRVYNSEIENLIENFYEPVFGEALSYDRITAYISAKAFASNARGLESFSRKKGAKYRLIVSTEISQEDYNQIKKGYSLKEEIERSLVDQLKESLSLSEERNISNLAYLISLDVVEVKMAFSRNGIQHEKSGLFKDSDGEVIYFIGSNNETRAALEANIESLIVISSLYDNNISIINSQIERFEKWWDNNASNVIVRDLPEIIFKELASYNKGKIIFEEAYLVGDCVVLDYRNNSFIVSTTFNSPSMYFDKPEIKAFFKIRLGSYKYEMIHEEAIFESSLSYLEIKRLIKQFQNNAKKNNYLLQISRKLEKYIDEMDLLIETRSRIGHEIKKHNPKFDIPFKKFSEVVQGQMVRPLREKQLWDSFFLTTMKKGANFSVPGSGKTATILGMFAYLSNFKNLEKLMVIGPINSLEAWKTEFDLCFGDKRKLKYYSVQESKSKNLVAMESSGCNLMLFNYESLPPMVNELCKLIDSLTLLVFDEVHRVKRIDGYHANAALQLAKKSSYTIILTGTPIPNSFRDIYNPLHLLFPDEYDDYFGLSESELSNMKENEIIEINKKFQPFFCRTTKEDLSVRIANPDKVYRLDACNEESIIFINLIKKYKHNPLSLMIRLLQLESNPSLLLQKINGNEIDSILDSEYDISLLDSAPLEDNDVRLLVSKIDRSTKVQATLDLIEELSKQGKSVIVWCYFIDTIINLVGDLNRRNIKVEKIFGETPTDLRVNLLNDFKNKEFAVLVTNPNTLAESISLHQICHDAIYMEYTYNLVHLLQSKDRIHRLGLPDNQYTQYYFMQVNFDMPDGKGQYSIGNQIYNRLKLKEELMLKAISEDMIESMPSSQDDMEAILKPLRLL